MPRTLSLVTTDPAAHRRLGGLGWTVDAGGQSVSGDAWMFVQPDAADLDAIRALRASGDRRPVLVLATGATPADVIAAFEAGADDHVAEPVDAAALAARLDAHLRRAGWGLPAGDGLDADRRVLRLGGRDIPLTAAEGRLVGALADSPGRPLTRAELWAAVGEDQAGYDRAIDLHVARLRAKIEDNPKEPRHLLTVRGLGYRFAW